MSDPPFYLTALLMAAGLVWQLWCGMAFGSWRRPRVERQAHPVKYWLIIAVQMFILLAFLKTGGAWRVRRGSFGASSRV